MIKIRVVEPIFAIHTTSRIKTIFYDFILFIFHFYFYSIVR